jgi:hypothetical protein
MNQAEQIQENPKVLTKCHLSGYSFTTLLNVLRKNNFKIDSHYLPRLAYCMLFSLAKSPLNLIEAIKYKNRIRSTAVKAPPIFILGHWRSGTTLLYRLLSSDPQFGFLSMGHALFPSNYWVGSKVLRTLLMKKAPKKRLQDNMPFHIDFPGELEFALSGLSSVSFYPGFLHFPNHADKYEKYLSCQNISEQEKKKISNTIRHIIQKETLYRDGQQLVIKNPTDTARIKLLLDLFPDAKFVSIHRHPYDVISSTLKMLKVGLPVTTLQKLPSVAELQQIVMSRYKTLYNAYLEQKDLIPKNQLFEIRFEDFVTTPLDHLKNLYQHLQLPNFDVAAEKFKAYFDVNKDYKSDRYNVNEPLKSQIDSELAFAFRAFGYD